MGFAVDVHYCEGEIASIKPVYWKTAEPINTIEKECCPPKSLINIKKNESCCKDKLVHFQKKLENATIKSQSFQPYFNFLFERNNSLTFSNISILEDKCITSFYCDANAPPLFKLYHQYIFYA
jgi:hypothetical protein